MKKFLLIFSLFLCGTIVANAQKVYEVGADKTHTRITDAWAEIKESTDTEFIINVAEGTYIEGELAGYPDKKITIVGAGADKTVIKRADFESFEILDGQAPGYLFRSPRAADPRADNMEVICEGMTFQNIGASKKNWGGALIVSEAMSQKFTFKNCMFTNIYARQGALAATNPIESAPFTFVMEDCFVENCGSYDFNHNAGILTFKYGGDVTIKNTTFMNNIFHLYNQHPTTEPVGGDLDRKTAQILIMQGNDTHPSKLLIENVNILNSKIEAEATSTCPIVKIYNTVDAVEPFTSLQIKDLVMLNNARKDTPDGELFFDALCKPTFENSYFNSLGTMTLSMDGENQVQAFTKVDSYAGVTVDADLTYNSPKINLEMDGDLPKIFVNEKGVKYLRKAEVQSLETEVAEELDITINNGVLSIVNLEAGTAVSIFDFAGKELQRIDVQSGVVEFSLEQGAYIVKAGSKVAKVIL